MLFESLTKETKLFCLLDSSSDCIAPSNVEPIVQRKAVVASRGGGGFFHSKGTWGCAAREGILFRPSSLAKGVLFGNFNRVKSRQGYAFWEFWSKRC